MEFNNLLVDKDGAVAVVQINRPKALNALNDETLSELEKAFTALGQDDTVQAIVLTGAGDKAFVAGADIAFMQNMTPLEGKKFAAMGQKVFATIENLPKPVIAAINGFALGGGCELAMSCDIRLASAKAKFGQPEVNLGIMPGFAGTQRLPRLVGKGIAKELILTADTIGADEAYRIGLVNKVYAPEELLDAAKAMAKKLAAKSAPILALCKAAINEGLEMDVDKAYGHEANLFGLCFATSDQREGMTAFLEKRAPNFQNK